MTHSPERLNFESRMMAIVEAVALGGTCGRRRVGALAVRDSRILATGYNGAPSKVTHCEHERYSNPADDPDLYWTGERWSCNKAVHAEANVIAYAAKFGVALEGSVIYTNTYPCLGCFRQMVTAGVHRVVYSSHYFNDPGVEALSRATLIEVVRLEEGLV